MAMASQVVTVSDCRRRLATLIDEVNRSGHPLFVTQYGQVTAVLVSAEEYSTWRSTDPARRDDGRCRARRRSPRSVVRVPPSHRSPRLTPLPTRRVWTEYGLCDYETAQVLAEQGVDTELVWTEEGWLTDDEG